jgi:hypothetical protein
MEEKLLGQIFGSMIDFSALGKGFVSFSDTRCGRVAKQVKI